MCLVSVQHLKHGAGGSPLEGKQKEAWTQSLGTCQQAEAEVIGKDGPERKEEKNQG